VRNRAFFAADICRASADTKMSAFHWTAQATCNASMARIGLTSNIVVQVDMTGGVRLTISASEMSSDNRFLTS
jgi:hypothetical protein